MAEADVTAAAPLTLICGPSGSGKSRWAEHLASQSTADEVIYVATGPADLEDWGWQERLRRHRDRRPSTWLSWEVQGELSSALRQLQPQQLALVDSLGTWVAAHLDRDTPGWLGLHQELLEVLHDCPAELVLVCEEVSWGVVPATALGCRFRDRLSELNRSISPICSAHWLVVQGRALDLMRLGIPVPEPG
ncbi:MAG: bifunctional adenosylcobinamide kinase/adenosylcobinamide-phosphate guanylyltransferase [Synechococcaceae cyanobacterium]|jgi:adenosylcobinamide kinase/adenosylcobinamide-phosphate guanylyltransferase|nr:bifunctional adenosylcobinamide kinase/adenosylcobinamide-phosphate guanylyltransferase [Synechococcaceae cyanobacterium]